MGIMSRLNRLDARFSPGMRREGESDADLLARVGRSHMGLGGRWWVIPALARQVTSLERRVAELERQLAERG